MRSTRILPQKHIWASHFFLLNWTLTSEACLRKNRNGLHEKANDCRNHSLWKYSDQWLSRVFWFNTFFGGEQWSPWHRERISTAVYHHTQACCSCFGQVLNSISLFCCIPAMNFMISPIYVRESNKYNEKKIKLVY